MNNICYNIIENSNYYNNNDNNDNNNSNNSFSNNILSLNSNEYEISEKCARKLDYDLNYNTKYLIAILEFYGFKSIKKLNKKELIEKIIEFEFCINNYFLLEERKRLFDNFIELKNNKFFSKYILSGFN
tara:strand:- start:3289 stop:3675 length:387 start_codon:yes stop_codon:yes gene_type:complete